MNPPRRTLPARRAASVGPRRPPPPPAVVPRAGRRWRRLGLPLAAVGLGLLAWTLVGARQRHTPPALEAAPSAFVNRIRAAVTSGLYGDRAYEVLPGRRSTVDAADEAALWLRDGPNRQPVPWSQLEPRAYYVLLAPLDLEVPERLALAAYGLFQGLPEEAARQLCLAWSQAPIEDHPSLFDQIVAILDEPAASGKDRSVARATVAKFLGRCRGELRKQAQDRAETLPRLASLVALRRALDDRRRAAWAALEENADTAHVLEQIDLVRRIWEAPCRIEVPAAVRREMVEAFRISAEYLPRLEGTAARADAALWSELAAVDTLDVREIALTEADRELRRRNRLVRRANDAAEATPEARELGDRVNTYRAMLGLPELLLDARLASPAPPGAPQLASSQASAEAAIGEWLADPASRARLLSPACRRMGTAQQDPATWLLVLQDEPPK